jgi:cytoplasmic iron level regulating protein YaaA (DUF328/UPF0246 family)
VEGPDFGGDATSGRFLSACCRYDGRFFREIRWDTEDERDVIKLWENAGPANNRTLILSALYGLVLPLEPIQEYTCHFADRLIAKEQSLAQIWNPILTQIILFENFRDYTITFFRKWEKLNRPR